MQSKKSIIYGVNDKPSLLLSLFMGIQHVLLVFNGTVLVPIIIARASNLSVEQTEYIVFATIIVSTVSTIIQVVRFGKIGSGYMLFMGSSGAYIATCLSAARMGGLELLATMTILSAFLELGAAYFIRHVRKIITPAVGGVVIMLVTISILPIIMNLWTGAPGDAAYCDPDNLIAGLVTIGITLLCAIYGSSKFRLWSPILGIVAGILACQFLGILDLTFLRDYPVIGLPRGRWPGIELQLGVRHIPLLLAFLFATLASTIESVGDSIAIQEVSNPDFRKIDYNSVQGCLYSDGLGNILAGLLGTAPNTTYSGNIAAVELTGVAARRVGIMGAVTMGLLAFFPKIAYFFTYIPGPVLAGSSLVLMALLFSAGVKLVNANGLNYEIGLLVGVSLTVGIISTFDLFFPALIPESLKPFASNGIATGGLTAFVLSLVFYLKPKRSAVLRLDYDPDQVAALSTFIRGFKDSYRLSSKEIFELQLGSEEVFSFICNTASARKGKIRFKWLMEPGRIAVSVEDQSDIGEVDLPRPMESNQLTAEDLDQLGLLILNKIARNVVHYRIEGHNSISFDILRE